MSLDKHLLEVLVCPVTKQPVFVLNSEMLLKLNKAVQSGEVVNMSNKRVVEPLSDALISKNRTLVYPIENGVPVMLEDEAIPTDQIVGFK